MRRHLPATRLGTPRGKRGRQRRSSTRPTLTRE